MTQQVAERGFAPRDWQTGAPRQVWGTRPPVAQSDELRRVLALPRRPQELDGTERAEAIIDQITARFGRGPRACRCAQLAPERHAAEGCITRLRCVQAWALREIAIAGGLLGPIGVGHGKTLLDLLAVFAAAPHGVRRCVLLCPPKLVGQLVADYDYLGEHFQMPTLVVQGSDVTREQIGAPLLQVMPYSRIMRKESAAWLEHFQPDMVVADECHKLRDANTATTARVMRYLESHPGCKFACWSGSITSKSIKDYAHLARYALRRGSPLPLDPEVVDDWARATDPKQLNPADPGPLLEGLIETQCCAPGESLYDGIRRRVCETMGVVATTAASVSAALEICERPIAAVPPAILELIKGALEFRRPDGEELVTAMQAVECAIQIAHGFHYKWIFPKCEFPRDMTLVLDWLERRKEWHKELRAKLKARDEYLDSPQLLEHAAERHYGLRPAHRGLPSWAPRMYLPWREIKPLVQPVSVGVRLDDFLVRDAAEWAAVHRGIVWYQHGEFGKWLSEVSGLPLYGAGDESKRALLAEDGSRSVICSMPAHGTGTNGLQFKFGDMLFGNNPADSAAWEQPLGRLHRPGARFDVVRAWYYMHTAELRKHVKAALRAALYVQGTTGSEQKLRVGFPFDEIDGYEDEE